MDWKLRRGQIKHLLYELALSGRISKELFKEQLYDLNNVEPIKHGRWIKIDKHTVKCSECGNYLDMRGVNAGRGDANYCPNCGARIDEEPMCDFRTYGAKKYATVEDGELKCTIAGVPKKAGGKIIGTLENFRLGLNFKGSETGKQCLWYNEAPEFKIHDEQGREIEIHSNVAMLPVDYLLSISPDYTECLSVEGNFHWNFKEADRNVLNEEDL